MARTKKADQAKNAGKNAKDAAQEPEAVEQAQEVHQEPEAVEEAQEVHQEPEAAEEDQDAAQEPEAEEEAEEAEPEPEEAEPDMFANLPNPCVYCGPSVKGVARQYTTYQGGIPDALRNFIKDHPGALGLIVPTGTFPAMRRRLEKHGTKEAELYKAVKEEL